MGWIYSTHVTCLIIGIVSGSIMTNRGWRKRIGDFTKEVEQQLDRNKETQEALSKVIEQKEKELQDHLNNRK
ncbi:hypothetical protein LCGC14_3143670 [marine sediment metagenome]|uniref:Uncharacterized protein n=1 Tax=marine sediment metagenome TaxID=412755 RepID=A0A0F8VW89_9ZZZZ|nr:hypothetical protein [Phycisphaerales bacterium]